MHRSSLHSPPFPPRVCCSRTWAPGAGSSAPLGYNQPRTTRQVHGRPAPSLKPPPRGGTRGSFLPSGGPVWGIAPLSHQEDPPPRGSSIESTRTLKTCTGDELRARLWLNNSKGASYLTKQGPQEQTPPNDPAKHTPECRGHSRREKHAQHLQDRKERWRSGERGLFSLRPSTVCTGAPLRTRIK